MRRKTYDYVLKQAEKAGIVKDFREYPNTRLKIDLERGLARALQLKAFLPTVPYPRYKH